MTYALTLGIKNHQQPVTLAHGGGNAVLQAGIILIRYHQFVNDHLDIMVLVAVQFHAGKRFAHFTVHADVKIAFFANLLEQLLIMSLTATYQRSKNVNAFPFVIIQNKLKNLLFGIFHHFFTGKIRISFTGTGIQQTKIIVYLRCRTYGRTWVFIGCLLLNGNHRAQSCNLIYIGTFQIAQEVTGISGKCFNITALAFGEYRIERER